MAYFEIFENLDPEKFPRQMESLLPREELIAKLSKRNRFDIVVIGGGIHGVAFARVAAFNGVRVLLLERGDYAAETSSRSSKMAHGGLRYLELFDFRQVAEGVKAREDLFETAAHLVRPAPFLIPVMRGDILQRIKLKIGLTLYDRFVKRDARRHRWIPQADLHYKNLEGWSEKLSGCYEYQDGIMDDLRLVYENLNAARREGAYCFNYAEVIGLRPSIGAESTVTWIDQITKVHHEIRAGIVVNCAGPWVAEIAQLAGIRLHEKVAFSKGSHLIFDLPWSSPALCLPMGQRGRYYFVWPHPIGTMVGTTEYPLESPERSPLPTPEEVEELLLRVQKDLPAAGLTRDRLVGCFAGVRTLPVRKRTSSSAQISRRHWWHYERGVLTLIGGKYTTAAWTAYEGLSEIFKMAALNRSPVDLRGSPFVGAIDLTIHTEAFRAAARQQGVPETVITETIRRRGARVDELVSRDPTFTMVAKTFLASEIDIALEVEQVVHFCDLARRIELSLRADLGEGVIAALVEYLEGAQPQREWRAQAAEYQRRITQKKELLGK